MTLSKRNQREPLEFGWYKIYEADEWQALMEAAL